jgi:hypothetical protein
MLSLLSFVFYSILSLSLYVIGSVCALRFFKLVQEEAFVFYIFMMSLTEIAITGAIHFILVVWLFGCDPSSVLTWFFVAGFAIKYTAEFLRRRKAKQN